MGGAHSEREYFAKSARRESDVIDPFHMKCAFEHNLTSREKSVGN